MRIFVSYARVDKPTCVQIVELLDFHEVWYDQRLSAGQRWWKEINNRLEWCEGFIYLLSSDSLESEYCRREFEIAQNQGKHIFPILIEPDIALPDAISQIQYLDLSEGLTNENAHRLLLAIDIADQIGWRQSATQPKPVIPPDDHEDNTVNQLISEAAQAMEKGEYERAIVLIDRVLSRSSRPRFIDVEKLSVEARVALERQQMNCQMEREYSQIVELVRLPATRSVGMDAYEAFRRSYPDYDPDNLAVLRDKFQAPETKTLLTIVREETRRIPLMEWCEITAGRVRVNGTTDGTATRQVSSYLMARYPVTNRQYQAFIKAPSGYANPRWWDYSDEARWWRAHNPESRPAKYQGHDRPRETVTWFEARAFSLWLGNFLKLDLNLPTLQQRQRAIMGDDERIFPWGNTFDQNRCNTRESGLLMTTVVNRYPEGVSPYGVYDLAGNVWEWCADIVTEEEPSQDDSGENILTRKALVHGGAFVSPYNRCHVATYYPLPLHTTFASIGFRLVCNGQLT
jgi:formylglycine-generating enzyme required for sulfatase activity